MSRRNLHDEINELNKRQIEDHMEKQALREEIRELRFELTKSKLRPNYEPIQHEVVKLRESNEYLKGVVKELAAYISNM